MFVGESTINGYFSLAMWGFPEIGVPPVIIHFERWDFLWDKPYILMETPMSQFSRGFVRRLEGSLGSFFEASGWSFVEWCIPMILMVNRCLYHTIKVDNQMEFWGLAAIALLRFGHIWYHLVFLLPIFWIAQIPGYWDWGSAGASWADGPWHSGRSHKNNNRCGWLTYYSI